MTNYKNTVLYTGITNDLERRKQEHISALPTSFSGRYKTTKLVYFEEHLDVYEAIAREKQIKAGSRKKKVDLINSINPGWHDLLDE